MPVKLQRVFQPKKKLQTRSGFFFPVFLFCTFILNYYQALNSRRICISKKSATTIIRKFQIMPTVKQTSKLLRNATSYNHVSVCALTMLAYVPPSMPARSLWVPTSTSLPESKTKIRSAF